MFGSLGTGEIILIILVILLLFGAKKIPEVMRGLGTGMREFKRATREATEEFERLSSVDVETASPPPVKAAPSSEPKAQVEEGPSEDRPA